MKKIEYSFSDLEIDAILAALPLMEYELEGVSKQQFEKNLQLSYIVEDKLDAGVSAFTSNEIRVICASIDLADSILTHGMAGQLDPELRNDLSKHFFVYKKLLPRAEEMLRDLSKYARR